MDVLKINKLISTVEAEIKERQEELNLLQSRLGRSQSSTPYTTHCCFATEESPESTKNSRATKNVSPSQVDTIKTTILELGGNLASPHQGEFDTFKQLLAASLQGRPFLV